MSTLDLELGSAVQYGGERYVVVRPLDLQHLVVRHLGTGRLHTLALSDLSPVGIDRAPTEASRSDLLQIPDAEWKEARHLMEAIEPLLDLRPRPRAVVEARARGLDLDTATLYRWMKVYEADRQLSALLPVKRGRPRGSDQLEPAVEVVLQEVIETFYLRSQRPSVQQTCREVERVCRQRGLCPPHRSTVWRRIGRIETEERLARRHGIRHAEAVQGPLRGHFPGADGPLFVVQIDHTPLDLILVDEEQRLPIGRPWLTLAIDVYSRMVLGFYLSLDPPSAASVGLCLVHALLPKERWLARLGIEAEWPCWGVPRTIHVDNGKEFRGRMLERACEEYRITLEWRPVRRPHFGGHIERLLGTCAREIQRLEGATFADPRERGAYDPEGRACFTLREIEGWLARYLTGVYHARLHEELDTSPLAAYRDGILGTDQRASTGYPRRIADEDRLRLDLMPFVERTIQRYGVEIEGVQYWSDVLRPYVHASDPAHPRQKRRFLFRRDPRDISVLYFHDPRLNQYYRIPYRNTTRPPMSVWELRAATRRVREPGRSRVDETAIFRAYEELRQLEGRAAQETKRVRRAQFRSVSPEQPIFSAMDWIAAHCDVCSSSCSNTIRTARSLTSGEYVFGLLMTPTSQV